VKKQLGYAKTVYRGLKKNLHRFYILFASANLLMCIRAGRQEEFCCG
jgi:IS5 family transposase